MWADNETDIDLLGFSYLVDELVVALTEPRLLPLTVGILGDWGSGKSSLLRMVRGDLESLGTDGEDRYVCASFSPWQHEDYEDVKSALMATVLERLAQEAPPGTDEQLGAMRRFTEGLRKRSRSFGRAAVGAAPLLATAGASAIDPNLAFDAAGTATGLAGVAAKEALRELESPAEEAEARVEITSVREFRAAFRDYVGSLEGVAAVIVFIDDLDRCLPETVVDTFEAIRLFLNAPETAYVVAANQKVVESAVDSRYPELRRDDGTGIGADYLEKMLQLKVAIPALSAPETESYANLLLADLHLSGEQMERVVEAAGERRANDNLTVAFNMGIASDVLKNVPDDLARDLLWTAQVAPALAAGLRGNPRQVKRFLNTIFLRRRSAQRRNVTLEPAVLAKLLVLEEQQVKELQTLFEWQVSAAGLAPELVAAEAHARGTGGAAEANTAESADSDDGAKRGRKAFRKAEDPAADDAEAEGKAWAEKPRVADWLRLDPPLTNIDLRPYFTYSRDRLSPGVAASALPAELQALVMGLQSEAPALRRASVEQALALDAPQRAPVVEALAAVIARAPGTPAVDAAVEIAEKAADAVEPVVRALMRVPPSVLPPAKAMTALRRLPADHAAVQGLVESWSASGVEGLVGVVTAARQAQNRRR